MTDFLVKLFVKDNKDVEKVSVRTAYGVLASGVGIFCNVFLFLAKLAIGLVLHSVSVTADAFNNLSDAGSSVIGLVGVKMAEKPADEEHPFGHGRMEYIAALVVAFLVIEVGFTFFKDSIGKIRHPEMLKFQAVSVVILILSVGVKLWMGMFNRKLGRRIDSQVMLATAADSLGDVITTTATIVSIVFWKITGINIDGFVGLGVSLVVMWAGIGIAKDTLEPLLGEAVSAEEYRNVKHFVEKYDGIVGSHDLIVHNYGPGRSMASIHAEVPNDVPIERSHEVIDRIERDASRELGIFLVIHMDPIETKNELVLKVKRQAEEVVSSLDTRSSIHDFRMVDGEEQINLIFDLVVPREYSESQENALMMSILERLQEMDARYQCVITVEKSYVAEK
ncbi:cation diffusion facilitator family transporter [Bariatricus massiliensis]|uniref:Cation diffusion facilitator family transporter n=1 Tax=Bariatricus massiliensis TaxID=1745713 RepID=A0ABS8DK56_9FIRM|nr:cation diffusion facilitator family transporter [Bariatricus massiliensis]MCB7305688.1 cation diffusion facilitator family transporter [Bariatricus massiliensis]MCB7376242.1 cation diffusion facilitator family transporter [Bariatricus massiliensis]MCB7388831.1 cation diffusion facilitator family transporter [Bariatricus massiliensis]MCB7413004.1 cation diffusion facilitator family transporter [Bariatricus massiliensis]MCQ5254409.1 cation diffusion facilitator family transporter [Bariatricus